MEASSLGSWGDVRRVGNLLVSGVLEESRRSESNGRTTDTAGEDRRNTMERNDCENMTARMIPSKWYWYFVRFLIA